MNATGDESVQKQNLSMIRCQKCRVVIDKKKYEYHCEKDSVGVEQYWCLFTCWYVSATCFAD